MAKQRLENCFVLSYLKKIHHFHVINPGVSGVKSQKYLKNFRREKASPTKDFFFLSFFFNTKIVRENSQ